VLFPASLLSPESPATIVRSRLVINVGSDQRAATEEIVGAFGCGFVNTVAASLGITALPGPATDCSWGGWFVHETFSERITVTTDIGVGNLGSATRRIVIDSKAMRKFEEDQALVWMFENLASTGMVFAVSGRMLVKAG